MERRPAPGVTPPSPPETLPSPAREPRTARVPSISTTEALVVDLLRDRERYGLELVEASGGRLKRGTIYVTLSRMEAKGFVTSRQEDRPEGAIGLPRRMYRVTPYGFRVSNAFRLLREALARKTDAQTPDPSVLPS